MATDFTVDPWRRLLKIMPPGTEPAEYEMAALRHAAAVDVYAAAADLWEDASMQIDTSQPSQEERQPNSVLQDGIQVLYGVDSADNQSTRIARQAFFREQARYFRSKSKAYSVRINTDEDEPVTWGVTYPRDLDEGDWDDEIIPVDWS